MLIHINTIKGTYLFIIISISRTLFIDLATVMISSHTFMQKSQKAKGWNLPFEKKRCKWRIFVRNGKKEFKEDLNFFPFQKIFSILDLKCKLSPSLLLFIPFLCFIKSYFISVLVAAKFSQEFDILPTFSFSLYWMVTFWLFCYTIHYSTSFLHYKAYFMFV